MVGLPQRVYYGWFVASAAAATEFANAASAIAILTVFLNPMTEEFGWSRTEFSGATSLGAILGAALAPLTGMMVDRLGSRILLAIGGLVVAAACFYLATAQTLVAFYIAFTLARTADQGLIKIGTSPVVAKWFRRYRGRAISVNARILQYQAIEDIIDVLRVSNGAVKIGSQPLSTKFNGDLADFDKSRVIPL